MAGRRYWPEHERPSFDPGSHWYRVRRTADDVTLLTVVAYPSRALVRVVSGGSPGIQLDPAAALGLSTCVSAAVEHSFPDVIASGLVVEGDIGGWRPV